MRFPDLAANSRQLRGIAIVSDALAIFIQWNDDPLGDLRVTSLEVDPGALLKASDAFMRFWAVLNDMRPRLVMPKVRVRIFIE